MGEANPAKRPEVRAKISQKLKGRSTPWLMGDRNPAKRTEVRDKIKNNPNSQLTRFKTGHTPANKGQTASTSEAVRRNAEARIGQVRTAEQKKRMREGLPENYTQIARESAINNILTGKWPKSIDIPTEREMAVILVGMGLKKDEDFIHPCRIGDYVFDFLVTRARLVLECDGREHHYGKKVRKLDETKALYLRRNGYRLARFDNWVVYNDKDTVRRVLGYFLEGRRDNQAAGLNS